MRRRRLLRGPVAQHPVVDVLGAVGDRCPAELVQSALATGSMPFAAPNLNAYAFARLAWNPGLGAKAVREAFCTHVFRSGLHMPAYFEALERAFALDLDLRPEEARLKGLTGGKTVVITREKASWVKLPGL